MSFVPVVTVGALDVPESVVFPATDKLLPAITLAPLTSPVALIDPIEVIGPDLKES